MIKECTVKELKERLDSDQKTQFFDCREVDEWHDSRINGVTLLPLSEIETQLDTLLPYKHSPIVIHCKSGKRSMNACLFLLSKGFTDLTNVEGGIMSWIKEGFPIIRD